MFLVLLLVSRIALIITSQSFEVSEEKVSEICSYLADNCFKCIQFKSCFWCPSSRYDKQINSGTCMANYNSLSRYNCLSRNIYNYKSQCPMKTADDISSEPVTQLRLLIKLLSLVKNLHQLKLNTTPLAATTQRLFSASVINKTTLKPKKKYTTQNTINSTTLKTFSTKLKNNKTEDVLKLFSTANVSSTELLINTTQSTTVLLPNDCQTKDKNICMQVHGCAWQSNKCSIVKRTITNQLSSKIIPHCVSKRTCGDCTESPSCYWCDKSKTCHQYAAADLIPAQCKDAWYHGECSYKTSVFLIIIPTISIIIFLSVAYVCIKNCYYHQLRPVEVKLEERPILFKEKNGKTVYQITESEDDDDDQHIIVEKSNLFW